MPKRKPSTYTVVYSLNGSEDTAWQVPIVGAYRAWRRVRELRRMGYEADIVRADRDASTLSTQAVQAGQDGQTPTPSRRSAES